MTSRAGESKIEMAAACDVFWEPAGEVWTNLRYGQHRPWTSGGASSLIQGIYERNV